MIRIRIEDLVANALIELNQRYGIRKVTGDQINAYEKAVLEHLMQQGIHAIYCCDRYMFAQFKDEYSDFFTVCEDRYSIEYFMNENISAGNLTEKFRGYLSLKLLLAFINDDVVHSLERDLIDAKGNNKRLALES
jgi:hypothetical protein